MFPKQKFNFYVHSKNCEQKTISFVMSVRLSMRPHGTNQLTTRRKFKKCGKSIFWKYIEIFKVH